MLSKISFRVIVGSYFLLKLSFLIKNLVLTTGFSGVMRSAKSGAQIKQNRKTKG
jgi:hypothetical protein